MSAGLSFKEGKKEPSFSEEKEAKRLHSLFLGWHR
jgi:hypothetical protein